MALGKKGEVPLDSRVFRGFFGGGKTVIQQIPKDSCHGKPRGDEKLPGYVRGL